MSNVTLVLAVLEGRHLVVPVSSQASDSGPWLVKAVGKISDGDTLATEAVALDLASDGRANFDSELVWTMPKNVFHQLRSHKAKIKLSIVAIRKDVSDEQLLGHLVFDLREAAIRPVASEPGTGTSAESPSRRQATWKRLIGGSVSGRGHSPNILVALFREAQEVSIDAQDSPNDVSELPTDAAVESLRSNASNNNTSGKLMGPLNPVLNAEKGYFTLVSDSSYKPDFLYLSIAVINLKVPNQIKQSNPSGFCFVSYEIFGTPIHTESFRLRQERYFSAERATIRLLTTPDCLYRYFSSSPALTFNLKSVNSEEAMAVFVFEWQKLFHSRLEDLKRGREISFEGPIKDSKDPQFELGLQISISQTPSSLNKTNISMLANQSITKPNTIEVPKDAPRGGNALARDEPVHPDTSLATQTGRASSSDSDDSLDISAQQPSLKLDPYPATPVSSMTVNVKSIEMNHPASYRNLVLEYKTKTSMERKSPSSKMFLASQPVEKDDVGRIVFDGRRFEVFIRDVKKKNQNRVQLSRWWKRNSKLKLRIVDVNKRRQKVGLATIDIGTASVTQGTQVWELKEPILDVSHPSSIIGYLHLEFSLKTQRKSSSEDVGRLDLHLEARASADLENWKIKQKELFTEQLQKKEEQHLSTLAAEWERRERERRSEYEALLRDRNEIQTLYDRLRGQRDKLVQREAEVAVREQQLKEKEEVFRKAQESRAKTLGWQVKAKERELQQQLDKLKSEHSATKEEMRSSKEKLSALQRDNLKLSNQMSTLKTEAAHHKSIMEKLMREVEKSEDNLDKMIKSREAFKKAWEAAEERLRKKEETEMTQLTQLWSAALKQDPSLNRDHSTDSNKEASRPASAANVISSKDKDEEASANNEAKAKLKADLNKLEQQKELLMRTGVYNSSSNLIQLFDEKISEMKALLRKT